MRATHHDADATSTETRAVSEAPSPWLALRVLLTVAAAVLLLVGSFLEWAGGVDGSEIAVQAYWSTDAGTAGFFSSAGLVTATWCHHPGPRVPWWLAHEVRRGGGTGCVHLDRDPDGPRGIARHPPGPRDRPVVRVGGRHPRADRRVLPVHAHGGRVHRIHRHGYGRTRRTRIRTSGPSTSRGISIVTRPSYGRVTTIFVRCCSPSASWLLPPR